MDIIQFINIIKKHIILLVMVPVLLALLMVYLTKNPTLEFRTSTTIYTGIASGYSLEQKGKMDYFTFNNSFDNLINVIKSRETMSETAIRLIVQGLSLDTYDKQIISKESFITLKRITPQHIKDMVVKPVFQDDPIARELAFEQTVQKFIAYKNASDTNFVYNILNYEHKFYSIRAINKVSVSRVKSSDLIEMTYQLQDPGVALQTLNFLTEVFIRNFKSLKENQSDAVVAYFSDQVNLAKVKLNVAENKLLEFNKGNQIINYYEQSKFIASKKEGIETDIQIERMKLAGAEQALQNLENKLQVQGQIQSVTDEILIKRNRLVEITEKITINEIYNEPDTTSKNELDRLKIEADILQTNLNQDLNKLYSFNNSLDGIPISTLLAEWLDNLIKFAEAKAGLGVLLVRQDDFKKNYELFAPLGATISRIEREIDVAEREYLSLLQSLNEAKLKQQNEQLSSNIKTLDPAFYPITAIPSKRKIIVIAAALFGFLAVAFLILVTEYFDNTIKTLQRAESFTKLKSLGLFPRIISKYRAYNLAFINQRLSDLCIQEIKDTLKTPEKKAHLQSAKTIIIYSTQEVEGKSYVAGKLVNTLRSNGDNVLYLNFKIEDFDLEEIKDATANEENTKENGGFGQFVTSVMSQKLQSDSHESVQNNDNLWYKPDDTFIEKRDIFDLIQDQEMNTIDNYKYVFIELPGIIKYPYPHEIVRSADLSVIVARANREWLTADQAALDLYTRISEKTSRVILNATEINEIENVLGVLPKKRSIVRRLLRQTLKLQFYTSARIK